MERTMAVCPSPEANGSIGVMPKAATHGEHTVTKQNMVNSGFATRISKKVKMLGLGEGELYKKNPACAGFNLNMLHP